MNEQRAIRALQHGAGKIVDATTELLGMTRAHEITIGRVLDVGDADSEDDPPDEPKRPPPNTGDPYSLPWVQEILELRELRRNDWTVIQGDFPGGGPHKFLESQGMFENMHFELDGREVWIGVPLWPDDIDKLKEGLRFSNITVGPLPGTDPDGLGPKTGAGPSWVRRVYGADDVVVEYHWVHDLGAVEGTHRDNHVDYFSGLQGKCIWRWCLYERCGGQGLQLRDDVNKPRVKGKPNEGVGWNPRMQKCELVVEDCAFLDTGFGSRGSFPVSVFIGQPGDETTVVMRRVLIDNSWEIPGPKGFRARGGVILGRAGGVHDHGYSHQMLEDVIVHTEDTDRGSYFDGTETLQVFNSEFVCRKGIHLDRRDYPHFANDRLIDTAAFEGCQGDAPIYEQGEQVGEIDEDLVIEKGRVVRRGSANMV